MNQVVQLEQNMKSFLLDFSNAFNLVQNPQQGLEMNYVENQAISLSKLAQDMQQDIQKLKQIDIYTEEEIQKKTEQLQNERKIALQNYLSSKEEADKLNENLKANIDNLANKLYNLNE